MYGVCAHFITCGCDIREGRGTRRPEVGGGGVM